MRYLGPNAALAVSLKPNETEISQATRVLRFTPPRECLAAIYSRKPAVMEALKKSLLHRAFTVKF